MLPIMPIQPTMRTTWAMRILDGGGQAGNPGMAFREMSSGASKSSTPSSPPTRAGLVACILAFPKVSRSVCRPTWLITSPFWSIKQISRPVASSGIGTTIWEVSKGNRLRAFPAIYMANFQAQIIFRNITSTSR
jgi:hypothetical protein